MKGVLNPNFDHTHILLNESFLTIKYLRNIITRESKFCATICLYFDQFYLTSGCRLHLENNSHAPNYIPFSTREASMAYQVLAQRTPKTYPPPPCPILPVFPPSRLHCCIPTLPHSIRLHSLPYQNQTSSRV